MHVLAVKIMQVPVAKHEMPDMGKMRVKAGSYLRRIRSEPIGPTVYDS